MSMESFAARFPEVAATETRSIFAPPGAVLPAGQWIYTELYCNERGRDCRRVTFVVMRPGGTRIWATLSFGWESAEYYRQWIGLEDDEEDSQGPYIDPICEQSIHSPELLRLLRDQILPSPGFVDRLKRHYRMFRDSVDGKRGRKES